MTRQQIEERIAPARYLLGYFDQQALASYLNEPHKYEVATDSFEGRLTLTDSYYAELEKFDRTDEWLDLRFGYRTLENGELAIVLWLPDLQRATKHQDRWIGFLLHAPVWTVEHDERFLKWAMRNLEGCWEVDNGPKFYLAETMRTISGLTQEVLGASLFEYSVDSGLSFPSAENTHRYQDAHRTLYGYLIDGISKDCLVKLAVHLGESGKFNGDRTVTALTKLLPSLAAPSKFASAAKLVSEQRRLAAHKVRPPAQPFTAFAVFTRDLNVCVEGLKELLSALEKALNVDGISAQRRKEAKDRLPNLDKPVHKFASIQQASQMIGKTIKQVKFGQRKEHEALHGSEGLLIYFTDGSILGIETGSNVSNITSDRDDLEPKDFHTDFALTWVPSLKATV